MKTTVRVLAVFALSAAVLPLMAGTASAQTPVQPSVIPSQGNEDAVTAISPRGSEKHYQAKTAQTLALIDARKPLWTQVSMLLRSEEARRQWLLMRVGAGREELSWHLRSTHRARRKKPSSSIRR